MYRSFYSFIPELNIIIIIQRFYSLGSQSLSSNQIYRQVLTNQHYEN